MGQFSVDLEEMIAQECSVADIEQLYLMADRKMEYICRTIVTPPLKGEVTMGKLKYRGVKLMRTICPDKQVFEVIWKGKHISTEFNKETEEKFRSWLKETHNEIVNEKGLIVKQ